MIKTCNYCSNTYLENLRIITICCKECLNSYFAAHTARMGSERLPRMFIDPESGTLADSRYVPISAEQGDLQKSALVLS